MEAYCNAVRALEDKFYGIELNHVPRKHNEEADELAKIASRRITVPPTVFARDVAKPSINLGPSPSSQDEPSGAPLNLAGAEPKDEDPSKEAFVLSLLEGYGADEAEAMETEPTPRVEYWRAKYLAWMNRGELPPRSVQSQAHCQDGQIIRHSRWRAVKVRRIWHLAVVHPYSPWSSAHSRHPRGRVWPSHRTTHPRGQRVPPRLLLAHRGR
jgi:hypothetical protein